MAANPQLWPEELQSLPLSLGKTSSDSESAAFMRFLQALSWVMRASQSLPDLNGVLNGVIIVLNGFPLSFFQQFIHRERP